jgi:hypothetical protein
MAQPNVQPPSPGHVSPVRTHAPAHVTSHNNSCACGRGRCAAPHSVHPPSPFPPPLFERGCMARLTSDFRGPSSSARTKVTGCTQHTKRSPQWYSRLYSPETHVYTHTRVADSTVPRIFLVVSHAADARPGDRRHSGFADANVNLSLSVVRESRSRERRCASRGAPAAPPTSSPDRIRAFTTPPKRT